jgi:UDP-N-acetylglucosamine 2-epimerase (non-hydrolysing)
VSIRHIVHVVGARPNFMKAAPVMDALRHSPHMIQKLLHTGQHYDRLMSSIFFSELGLPDPVANLGVGSGSHAVQTGTIMIRLDEWLDQNPTDLVIVYGDVNSTVAATQVCAKRGIDVAHVEAGLRSFDRTMPEEINRVMTDQVANLLFTPSEDANMNLLNEGIAPTKVHFVGNVMIDSLVRLLPLAMDRWEKTHPDAANDGKFILATLHRPSNVDNANQLSALYQTLCEIADWLPVVFPVHPRTRTLLEHFAHYQPSRRLILVDPVGYLEFIGLQAHAALVLTDSGGVQEETSFLGIPCLTLRENTERPITVSKGTNTLVGTNPVEIKRMVNLILSKDRKASQACIPLWDGRAGVRIADVLAIYG